MGTRKDLDMIIWQIKRIKALTKMALQKLWFSYGKDTLSEPWTFPRRPQEAQDRPRDPAIGSLGLPSSRTVGYVNTFLKKK